MEEGPKLGYGVRAERQEGRLVVTSEWLDLGWRLQQGRVPGTAVQFGGELWEVVESGNLRWVLSPWPEGEAVRQVRPLDIESLRRMARDRKRQGAEERRAVVLALVAPVLGFAPAAIQERWHRLHGYPAGKGTLASVVLEMVVGGFAVAQMVVLHSFGDCAVPPGLWWLMPFAAIGFFEGLVRLALGAIHLHPVGSIPGAVVAFAVRIVTGKRTPGPAPGAREGVRQVLLRTAEMAAVCLAPGALQQRWTEREQLPWWLPTALGAGLETLGGLVNLARGDGGPGALLSAAFLAEGTLRLVWTALSREGTGSLLGLPLAPWLRRRLDHRSG